MTTEQLTVTCSELDAARLAAPAAGGPPSAHTGPQDLRHHGESPASQVGAAAKLRVPRYQLNLELGREGNPHAWRFVLRPSDGHRALSVEDHEPGVAGEQLELLTLVRGLEALDQPSAVTVFGYSRYLRNGITYGLPEWRENGWQWERFGRLVPIKHVALWQRLDRAMQIHRLACGFRRIDTPRGGVGQWHRGVEKRRRVGLRDAFIDWVKYSAYSLLLAVARLVPQPPRALPQQ